MHVYLVMKMGDIVIISTEIVNTGIYNSVYLLNSQHNRHQSDSVENFHLTYIV